MLNASDLLSPESQVNAYPKIWLGQYYTKLYYSSTGRNLLNDVSVPCCPIIPSYNSSSLLPLLLVYMYIIVSAFNSFIGIFFKGSCTWMYFGSDLYETIIGLP